MSGTMRLLSASAGFSSASANFSASAGVLVAVLAVGCGGSVGGDPRREMPPDAAASDTARIEVRLDSLRILVQEIARASPAEEVGVCRAIPFGAKPCGGPRAYLVYSAQATDSGALARAAEEFEALDGRRNDLLGLASDCALVTAPDLEVVQGTCRAEGF